MKAAELQQALNKLRGHFYRKIGQHNWDVMWDIRSTGTSWRLDINAASRYRNSGTLRLYAAGDVPPELGAEIADLRLRFNAWVAGGEFDGSDFDDKSCKAA